MARRLPAFALALIITGAPVATTVCQVTCAAHDVDAATAMGGAEHHSCHCEPRPTGPSVTGATHACGHSDHVPPGIDQSLQVAAAPAVTVATPSLIPPIADAPRLRSARIEHSPPGLVGLSTYLRI